MQHDIIWQAFAQTGNPLLYLLYKSVKNGADCEKDKREEASLTDG